ncbi:FG-GAP repeat domain-containing protein [Alienimonas sp. DA493]|uniref:FG-GAP repeat domain-containing protein n=1 Tax=Alienimonas sp. DA493 TaxID=3373605 RepID=UPI0037540656
MTAPPRRRPFFPALALGGAGLLIVVGGVAVVWLFGGPRTPEPAEAARLVQVHNAAVAALEAGDPAAAGALLDELLDEPLPTGATAAAVRNRAVGAVLAVDAESGSAVPPDDRAAWFSRAETAVAALKEQAPGAPAGFYLASRLAAAAGNDAAWFEALQGTAGRADGGWGPFLLYEAFGDSRDADRKAAAIAALGDARRLEPDNVWILLNAVRVAAEAESPIAPEAFAALRQQVAPYANGFALRQNGDVLPLIDAGRTAAEAGDWEAARRNATLLFNILRAEEIVRSDRLAVQRHPLDFLIADLPASFYDAAGLSRTPDAAAIPVRYAPFAGPAAAPEVKDVRAVTAANLDLLGQDELIVLTADAVLAFSRTDGGPWAETLRYDLPTERVGRYVGLLAADLDLDSDAAPAAAAGRDGPAVACHTADPDLVLWGPGGVLVLENRLPPDGVRTLAPVADQAVLNALSDVAHVAAADLDQEGDLDLAVLSEAGPSLWFNRGNLTFEDRTGRSDLGGGAFAAADVLAVDLDRDVDLDLLWGAAGEGAPVGMWENLRHGEFRARIAPAGGPLGLELLDVDGNASWDLAVADGKRVRLHPSVTPAPGRVTWGEPRTIAELPATRLRAVDHDNDGRVDLLAWGPDGVWLLRNTPGGWENVSDRLPSAKGPMDEALPRDLDGDGDLDLVVLTGGRLALWENSGGDTNASLQVALLAEFDNDGTAPKRVNHVGLGSLLELRRGPVYQPAVVRDAVTHFGLGPKGNRPNDAVPAGEALRVLWTNGIPEVVREPTGGPLCHPQKLGGSCPYLYTWNGKRFVFATDLCWAAPIGLQLAEGVFAPTRAWEHVKIDGAALQPRDGRYELRVTCELWEADYFDQIELTCVDHPPGTHVFTNEKVGPSELVEPRIYAAETLHEPAAARVRSGEEPGTWRDVLETIRTRDEDYLRPFRAKRTQGYTEPWTLELDLAGAPRVGAVLLLTGWTFPTDTGLNVALSQNPDLAGPRPPTLALETADGWETVLPNAGFPGGKTKTIALPLPAFPTDSRRVRLSGTQELYWDRAAWCAPGNVEVRTTTAELTSADLRYRGFSARRWPASGHGPDQFDYQGVTRTPLWPPMAGPFTRFGDVRELLTAADDRQAVLASGDEIALSFTAPSLPKGWTRDFVISSIGYDKDANLHTVHGQTVEPLPHAAMTRYPPPPDEAFPDTPELRNYLQEYQTRPADARGFWRAMRDGVSGREQAGARR